MARSFILVAVLLGLFSSPVLGCTYKFAKRGDKDIKWKKTYTMFYCDKGDSNGGEWHLFNECYEPSIDKNRCKMKQLYGSKTGSSKSSYKNYAHLFPIKGEGMKGLQHYEQFIVKCDDDDDGKKGYVTVNAKKCKTRSYALIVRLAFGLTYKP